MVTNNTIVQYSYTPQMTTTNQSFIDIHYWLRSQGRQNNSFFLALFDTDLAGVDPRDPNLTQVMKAKVLRECIINYWYFLREVVRIPDQGNPAGVRYKLHRGNLALNFLFVYNFNIFLELPRQHGKTTAALCRYLWVFNFGTAFSEIMFIHKKHDDSKNNLGTLKKIRELLPNYLQMSTMFDRQGKRIRTINSVETLQHPSNNNKIRTMPGAKNKSLANGLGRGCTMPLQYYDEFAFMLYNKIIYQAAIPAFSTASKNAKNNSAPYGILITTTPGDLTTDEGLYAEFVKNTATPWTEQYYDYTPQQLEELRAANKDSNFFYVRYTYQQLGSGEEYFTQMCKEMLKDWPSIRREVLLEWTKTATNCPFRQEDLDIIKSLCKKEPIRTILFGKAGQFQFQIWDDIDLRWPAIVGVDVAGGHQSDSSAVTVVDSRTTRVSATFNCNYITTPELADLLYNLITRYMPNCVVNIELNGGFGSSVAAMLAKTKVKQNLYYEIVDRVLEERSNGVRTIRKADKCKRYGINSSKEIRDGLIEILHERVNHHKDKFVAPILHSELETMEVKKNGKTEHASNAHDDTIFSYLMAMYVWYNGQNLMERYGIRKSTLKTDEAFDESYVPLEEQYANIEIPKDSELEDDIIQDQLKALGSIKSISRMEFEHAERKKDEAALEALLDSNPNAVNAYVKKYHLDESEFKINRELNRSVIPTNVINDFYKDEDEVPYDGYAGSLSTQYKGIDEYR